MNHKESRIIVSLDFEDQKSTLNFVQKLNPDLCRLKVGSILFTRFGPTLITELMQLGFDIFLDLKFHDIPNTVAGACRAAAELGIWMLTVHTFGGRQMLEAAQDAVTTVSRHKQTFVMGVTLLTSLDQDDLQALSIQESVPDFVCYLATIAYKAGLPGVVCSPHEVPLIRKRLPKEFLLITPGIRLESDEANDQKRIMTPEAAFSAGADYLVMGRSITEAKDPIVILEQLQQYY